MTVKTGGKFHPGRCGAQFYAEGRISKHQAPWGELHPKSLAESVNSRSGEAIAERIERFLAEVNTQETPDNNADGLLGGRDDLLAHLSKKAALNQLLPDEPKLPARTVSPAPSRVDTPVEDDKSRLESPDGSVSGQRSPQADKDDSLAVPIPKGRHFPPRRSRPQQTENSHSAEKIDIPAPPPPPPSAGESVTEDDAQGGN